MCGKMLAVPGQQGHSAGCCQSTEQTSSHLPMKKKKTSDATKGCDTTGKTDASSPFKRLSDECLAAQNFNGKPDEEGLLRALRTRAKGESA